MKIKVVSLDLDGTLISSSLGQYGGDWISEENIKAVDRYIRLGGKIILATGRSPEGAIKVFDVLVKKGVSSEGIPYIIALNGSVILYTSDGFKELDSKAFSPKLSSELADYLVNHKFKFFFLDSKKNYYSKPSAISLAIWLAKYMIKGYSFKSCRSDLSMQDIQKAIVIFCFGGLESMQETKESIYRRFGNKFYCSSGKRYLEIIDTCVDKFYALEKVIKKLGISLSELGAMGNEQNDVLSLENSGFGVALDFDQSYLDYDKSKIDFFVSNSQGNGVALGFGEMNKRGLFGENRIIES